MALTEGDKAICAEMTRAIVDEVVKEVLQVHLQTCPHGRLIAKSKVFFIGAFIGSGLASSSIVLAVAKVLGAV
jgi:hypothetical protein